MSDCSCNDVPHGNFVGHVIGSGRSCPVGKTSASCDQLDESKMIITTNEVPTGLCDYDVVVKPVSNKIFRVSLQGALIGHSQMSILDLGTQLAVFRDKSGLISNVRTSRDSIRTEGLGGS